jgi:metallo-beta-lactamase class B
MTRILLCGVAAAITLIATSASAGDGGSRPREPYQIYGNSYYVGVEGLSSVLITSPQGHILIDGALPDSPPLIAASIRKLGFKVEDIKLILTSHDHHDHVGGVAELQRMSGATVLASPATAASLKRGRVGKDDPQLAYLTPFARVAKVRAVRDGETIELGQLAVTALYTPGHTPGGTSWTWGSCVEGSCKQIVYADSINPISDDHFKFTAPRSYPAIMTDFARSYAALEAARCDIFLSAHPDFGGKPLNDGGDCKRYVANSREKLNARLASERLAPN